MNQTLGDITKIRLGTALTSLSLSIFLICNDDVINRDGILYIETAEAFLRDGLAGAAKFHDWPFFPILVAYFHQISSLSLATSAHVINILLAVLLTDVLILISHKTLPNSRQLGIAALLIVCFYSINDYRDFIIRDFGYWAFCSLTLYRFILYLESASIKNATLWQLSALIATLFRIEGMFALITLLPLYLFFNHQPLLAIKKILRLNYLIIIGGIIILITVISGMKEVSVPNAFEKILSISSHLNIPRIVAEINLRGNILETQVLHNMFSQHGTLILVSGLFSMLVFKLIQAISFGYLTIFVSSFWREKVHASNQYLNILTYFALIHILILAAFMYGNYFLSTRYTMMAVLTLLLLMLPRMTWWIDKAWQSKHKIRISFTGLVLLIGIADVATSSVSKTYITSTVIWTSNNIPIENKILVENIFSHYYLRSHGRGHDISFINSKKTGNHHLVQKYQNYDYLVTVEKRNNPQLRSALDTMSIQLLHCEQNKRQDKSCVYKIIPNE